MQFFALVAKSALALLFLLTVAVAQEADSKTVFDIINDTPELSDFAKLVSSNANVSIAKFLRNPNESVTVFVPTNTAIAGTSNTVEVQYHMASRRVLFAKGPSLELVATQLASPFSFDVVGVSRERGKNSVLHSNQKANVERADIIGSNGVVHIIDSVLRNPLMLEDTCDALGIAKFEASLRKIKLDGMVYWQPNRTTFVPTDEAMSKLPDDIDDESLRRILRYHSVPGGAAGIPIGSDSTSKMVSDNDLELQIVVNDTGAFVNGVHVSIANYIVREGIMHVIDGVITGPAPSLSDDGSNDSSRNNTGSTSGVDSAGRETENNTSGDSGGKLSPAVVAGITAAAVIVLGIVGVALYLRRKRKSPSNDGAFPDSLLSGKGSKGLKAFGRLKSRLSSDSSSVVDGARAELGVSATSDPQSTQPSEPSADSSKVVGTGQPFVPTPTGQPMS